MLAGQVCTARQSTMYYSYSSLPPVERTCGFRGSFPCLIKNIHNFLWQRSLLQISKITLQLTEAWHTNDDPISSILDLEQRMVNTPSQGRLQEREIMLLNDWFDQFQSFKSSIFEVSLPVQLPRYRALGIPTFGWDVFRFVFPRKDSTCQRITVGMLAFHHITLDWPYYITILIPYLTQPSVHFSNSDVDQSYFRQQGINSGSIFLVMALYIAW